MRAPLAALLLALTVSASAETFTTDAPSYPIDEPDLIQAILAKLKGMEASGRLAEIQQAQQEKAKDRVINPVPLEGFTKVIKPSKRLFDPSIELTRDVVDHEGRLVAGQGTRVNPLDYTSLTRKVALIDGRDPTQLDWAKQILLKEPATFVVLVAGSYYNLSKEFGRPIYFDQNKRISNRFGITRVPTLVYQSGKRIVIDEIALGH